MIDWQDEIQIGKKVELLSEHQSLMAGITGVIKDIEVIDYEMVRIEILWDQSKKSDFFSLENEPNILSKLKLID